MWALRDIGRSPGAYWTIVRNIRKVLCIRVMTEPLFSTGKSLKTIAGGAAHISKWFSKKGCRGVHFFYAINSGISPVRNCITMQ